MTELISLSEPDDQGMVTVTLNRADKANALNQEMQEQLTEVFHKIAERRDIQRLVLKAANHPGKKEHEQSFCAGLDLPEMLADMQKENDAPQINYNDALRFARLLDAVSSCGKPILGVVGGNALGLGTTLAALCDYVVAAKSAKFGYPEWDILKLRPWVSSPYTVARIGEQNAIHYFSTGKLFDAHAAQRMTLVDEIADPGKLDEVANEAIKKFRAGKLERERKTAETTTEALLTNDQTIKEVTDAAISLYANRSKAGREKMIEYTAREFHKERLAPAAIDAVKKHVESIQSRRDQAKERTRA